MLSPSAPHVACHGGEYGLLVATCPCGHTQMPGDPPPAEHTSFPTFLVSYRVMGRKLQAEPNVPLVGVADYHSS